MKHFIKAEQQLKTAVALDSTNPEILHEYGGILYTNTQHDKAIEYFNKALEILKKFLPLGHPTIKTVRINLKYAIQARDK